jgi:hypothetical protein
MQKCTDVSEISQNFCLLKIYVFTFFENQKTMHKYTVCCNIPQNLFFKYFFILLKLMLRYNIQNRVWL